ncbi:MAG TPA: NYN domain-containing protein [Hyphomicrobiaceae bacterium]|nr:NYN domain-containing protein [Hyphomicrobiaceae bacterium]
MKRTAGGACLSAVFVDYDNIYLSLKRKSDEAAKRFARDAHAWLREIESGRLITGTHDSFSEARRRIVMNRCYGNPVPRRNAHDNSTDMNSFPFVRHHFLRAGFEVVDCPPLTAQLKNSSDIRMVMDVRDYLTHETYFDEFIILSGDADFTPVLHRLRAHARRTVIYANDHTAAPYTAISDGEVRESDLIALILNGEVPADEDGEGIGPATPAAKIEATRRAIVSEIVADVRASPAPMLLEALADRTVRMLGHEKTIATGWAGAGSFRELLRQCLPADLTLTEEPPYLVVDLKRHAQAVAAPKAREPARDLAPAPPTAARVAAPTATTEAAALVATGAAASPSGSPRQGILQPVAPSAGAASAAAMQLSITRIQEACQAPALAPHEYRLLFELMAEEINENDLIGAQTLANITHRAHERGLEVRRDDVRFILEVVSESDPWFEQGASANLFAGRFRNFVVARCRGQGLNLSADELDLVDAWFAGGNMPQPQPQTSPPARTAPNRPAAASASPPAAPPGRSSTPPVSLPTPAPAPAAAAAGGRWWGNEAGAGEASKEAVAPAQSGGGSEPAPADEFPRFVRNRLRG